MSGIFVTQELPAPALAEVAGSAPAVHARPDDQPLPPDQLRQQVAGYQGVVCLLTDRIDEPLLAANPQLKVVANCAVGFDNIDVEAATRRGVLVTNTPGVLTDATADLAFALLLATARRVPEGDTFLRGGHYHRWKMRPEQLGVDVSGQTLGVFGLGKIGQAVARRARLGFDMRVLYHNRHRLPPDQEHDLGVTYADFATLLAESDFLSVHAPLTPHTRHALNAEAFAAMKPTAVLINTARGPIVDEAALAEALRNGTIWGAGLDVYEHEPRVEPKLVELHERVVLLPHLGSATERTRLKMARMALANARAAVTGQRPDNLVNPEALEVGQR